MPLDLDHSVPSEGGEHLGMKSGQREWLEWNDVGLVVERRAY